MSITGTQNSHTDFKLIFGGSTMNYHLIKPSLVTMFCKTSALQNFSCY